MAHHDASDPTHLLEHFDFARRLARSLVRDAGHAEDLVQEAWVTALERPPREGGAGARGFLATLVRRLRARQLRGEERRARRERGAARSELQPSSAELAATMEVHRRVVEALATLPEAQREALLLRYFEDLRPAAIAARLGVPVETVRTRVKRGLAGLRAHLERNGERDWISALVALGRGRGCGRPRVDPRRRAPRTARVPPAALVAGALLATFVVSLGVDRLLAVRRSYASGAPFDEGLDPASKPESRPRAGGDEPRPESAPRYAALPRAEPEGVPSPRSVTGIRATGFGTPRPASFLGALFGDSRRQAPPVSRALGLELRDVRRASAPTARARARVARATDATEEEVAAVTLFRGVSRQGEQQVPVRIARAPLPPGFPGTAVLLALDEDGRFVANAVVDEGGDAIRAWEHFLQAFVWAEVPRLDGARPRSWLAGRRRELEGRDDETARLKLALLRLLELMNEQASVLNLPRDGRPLTPEQEFAMMSEVYAGVAALAEDLEPLLGAAGQEFVRLALDSSASADGFRSVQAAGDPEAAVEIRRLIVKNCHACHDLSGHAGQGTLKNASAALRRELGVGDGFYQIGHDLRIRHADRDQAQVVADALRLAALAIDAAR